MTADVTASAAAPAIPLSRRAARQRLNQSEIATTEPIAAESVSAGSTERVEVESAEPVSAEKPAVSVSTEGPATSEAAAADAAAPNAVTIDAFEQAARNFRFGEGGSAKQETDAAASVDDGATVPESETSAVQAGSPEHVAPRRPRLRKVITLGATAGVMGLAGLLAVSMTLPAEAVAAVQGARPVSATSLVSGATAGKASAADEEIQAYVAPSDVQNESLVRAEDFSTVSLVDIAAEQGINYSNEIFTNDPDAAIQWPFLVGVGMSYGYGMRSGRLHEGIDFVPGNGAPVQAIADGTVRIATEQGGAYGVTVYIDHVVDGQVITSHYSHMQYGSLQVKAGETVKVGDIVGKTGNTGRSYGAHLHFEIIVNGSTIDPLPWLRENAGRYSY